MDWEELTGCKHKPAKKTLKGATRIYIYDDCIIGEMAGGRSKYEAGKFDLSDVYSVEKDTRNPRRKNGRPIIIREQSL